MGGCQCSRQCRGLGGVTPCEHEKTRSEGERFYAPPPHTRHALGTETRSAAATGLAAPLPLHLSSVTTAPSSGLRGLVCPSNVAAS